MGKFKKVTATVLSAVMALSVMSIPVFAEENAENEEAVVEDSKATGLPEAEDGVIKLTDDVTVDKITVTEDITYDLNGNDLTYTGGPIGFEEHTLRFIDSSVKGSKRGGTLKLTGVAGNSSAINPKKGATVEVKNIKIECTGSVFYPQGNTAAVNIKNCDIEAAVYGVGTNAATVDNYGVVINIENSKITTSSDNGDNTAVLINVEGTLNITDSELTSDRQALVVRAGDAKVIGTKITVTGKFAEQKDGNATKYQDGNWKSGNEVPTGAIIAGNTSENAYEAEANLTIEDCEIGSENKDVPAIFTDANKNFASEVEITGNKTVVTGSVMKNNEQENADIVIMNGTFTDDVEQFLDEDSHLVKDEDGNYIAMDEETYEDYLDDNKSHGSRYELEEKENDRKDDDDEDKEEDKKPEEKPEEPEEESIFGDVAIDDPNYDAIVKVFEKGWMVGVSDGVFAPNGTLTRGMAATILWNKAGKPEPVNAAPFLDVTADAWYAKAVAWAYEQGIVLGYDAETFGPNDFVTTEQFTIMLDKSEGKTPAPYAGGAPNATRAWVASKIA